MAAGRAGEPPALPAPSPQALLRTGVGRRAYLTRDGHKP